MIVNEIVTLFYQIRYSRENNRHSLDFTNAKQQMESVGEQPVSSKRFIAVFQIMQKSEFQDK